MPKEYKECVRAVEQESGKSHEDAQRICAIRYYKKHGKTPQEAESSLEFTKDELTLFSIVSIIGKAFDN